MSKDVNDRLKIIVSKNSNNILRIHKKLNNLTGGYNKFTGGSCELRNPSLIVQVLVLE